MGALHEGHGSLIRQVRGRGMPVVATVFVNPTQFGPREDFAKYPRTLEHDVALAERCGADVVFAPAAEIVYPDGLEAAQQHAASWPLPAVAREPGLEDACRPGHFNGVCQVVARLFDLTRPALAVFGEKDFQQLRVLTQMAAESGGRWGALRVEPGATVREPDGLAMSSRNRYLRPEQRDQALGLVRALQMVGCAAFCAGAGSEDGPTLVDSVRVAALKSLVCIVSRAPAAVEPHVIALAEPLLMLTRFAGAPAVRGPRPLIRASALDALRALASLPHPRLHPVRERVLQGLLPALDDPKRNVRRRAGACRNDWAVRR